VEYVNNFINRKYNWRNLMERIQSRAVASSLEKEIVENTQKIDAVKRTKEEKVAEILCDLPQGLLLSAAKRQRIDDSAQVLMIGLEEDHLMHNDGTLEQEMSLLGAVQESQAQTTLTKMASFIYKKDAEFVIEESCVVEEVVDVMGDSSMQNVSMIHSRCMSHFYKSMLYMQLNEHMESMKIMKQLCVIRNLCYDNHVCYEKKLKSAIIKESCAHFYVEIDENYKFLVASITLFLNSDEHSDRRDVIYEKLQDRVIQIRRTWCEYQKERQQSKISMIVKLQSISEHTSREFMSMTNDNDLQCIIRLFQCNYHEMINDIMSILSTQNYRKLIHARVKCNRKMLPMQSNYSISEQNCRKLIYARVKCNRRMLSIQSKIEKIDFLKEKILKGQLLHSQQEAIQRRHQKLKNIHNDFFRHYQILMQFLYQLFYPFCDINVTCQALHKYVQEKVTL